MKHYLRLVRVFAKAGVKRPASSRDWWQFIGLGLAIFVACIYVVGGLFAAFYMLFSTGVAAGYEIPLLAAFFMFVQLLSIALGMRISYSLFSGARDLPFLLALPIPVRTIFAARATNAYLGELGTQAIFLAPVCVAYLLVFGNAATWVCAIVAILLAPAIPLCISSFLTLLSARVLRGKKRGETLAGVLVLILSLGVSLGIQVVVRRFNTGGAATDTARELLSGANVVLSSSRYFPPAVWAAEGIAHPFSGGFWSMIAVNAVALVSFVTLGSYAYSSGLALQGDTSARSKRTLRRGGSTGALTALMRTEMRCLMRSPVYATNLLSVAIMGPFLLLVMTLSGSVEALTQVGIVTEEMLFYGLFGLMAFLNTTNLTLATTLSREGASIWIPQILPVSPTRQILARFLLASALTLLSVLTMAIVAPFILPISMPMALLAALLATFGGLLPCFVGAIPDLYRPKLGWSTEREAVKNNFNAFLGMVVGLLLMLPQVAAIAVAVISGRGIWAMCAVSLGVSAAEIAALFWLLPKVANEAFSRLRER